MFPPVTGTCPLVPDHPAQHVQRGVGAHERVAPVPVELAVHGVADGRQRPIATEGVPHQVAVLAHLGDRQPGEGAGVVRLPAAGRIEDGAVERHPALVRVDLDDACVDLTQLGITQEQQLGGHRPPFWPVRGTEPHPSQRRNKPVCSVANHIVPGHWARGGNPHMKTRRLVRAAGVLLGLSLIAAACGGDDDTDTTATTADGGGGGGGGETYKLAFVGPLTGDAANLGINIRNGIKVAIEESNAANDFTIELEEFDTQGDPAQATTLKDDFIGDDSILGVVGPTFSGETKALLPSFDEAGLVMVSPSATNVDLPEVVPDTPVFHRIIPDDGVQGAGLTDYVVNVLHAENVAYVNDNSEYGKGLADGTQALLEAAGVTTVAVESVDPKSQDFSSAVNAVKAAAPNLVFYGGYYAEAGRLRKQLEDAGVDSAFLTGDGSLDPAFIESAGAGGEGAQISCPCNLATEDSPDSRLADFAKAYKELNGAAAGTYSTEGYDAANMLIEGIKAGNTDRASLLDYVEGIDTYDGISKPISFEDNGNVKATDVFIFEVRDGKIALVGKTSELAG